MNYYGAPEAGGGQVQAIVRTLGFLREDRLDSVISTSVPFDLPGALPILEHVTNISFPFWYI